MARAMTQGTSCTKDSCTMSILVTKLAQGLIAPCRPTPSGTLPLSAIDLIPGLRCMVRSLHVFEHGHEPARALRHALSEALVPYYPLAGQLLEPSPGELHVACTGQGALFVEATADCTLEDVNYLDHPLKISTENLLPEWDPADLILMMQVTQFTCGGFVVGLGSVHAIADGLGAAQFINAVAELARGLHRPTVEPVWCREVIPSPPELPPSHPPQFPSLHLEYVPLHISLDHINQIKNQFLEQTAQRCSTFDISIAIVWQCRARAIDFEPGIEVHLCFMANTRHLLHQVLPVGGGYYGNCFYPVKVTAPSGKIIGASIIDVVKLIRDAKAKLPALFTKWSNAEFDKDPYELEFNYKTLFASDWTHLGFNGVDYGWGKPVHILPLEQAEYMPMCALGLPSPEKKPSNRLMTQCVEQKHLAAFQEQIMKLA